MLIAWDFVTLGFCNYEEAMDVWLEGSVCGVEGGSKELSWLKKEKIGTILKPWALGPLFVSRSCTRKRDMGGGGGTHPFHAWLARKSKTVKCSPQTINKLEIEDVLVIGRNIPDENKGPLISQHKVRLM
jgi:hypothetical protein